MKVVVLTILLTYYVKGQVIITAADNSGFPYQCLEENTGITLTCEFSIALTATVDWLKDSNLLTTCSNTADDTCIPAPGFSDARYAFTSTVAEGKFFLSINPAQLTDEGSFACRYSGTSASYDISPCECSEQTVENGDVNTTQTSVNAGTVIGITCHQGYTIEGSNVLICQADGQWNLQWPTCNRPTPPGPECCCICCFILLILNVVLNVVLVLVHVILTWQKHEFSVKKIYSGNNKTNEAVCFKDYGIKAALPECCVCVVTIVIQIAVYFAALIQKDCGDSCDKCCEVVICLVVTIIVSIVEAAAGSGIIYIFVNVKGCNYVDQGGNVDSGDSACCGRNNSILPICAGDDQQRPDGNKQKLSQGPRHRDVGTHQPGEPNSKTTKTDESGSFVSGKDIKVDTGGSSSFRAQPPLPDIKSEKKNTRGLSANIDDSDINNPSYEKKRLTPIGQESHPGWEEKTDRSEDGKEKKKKRKNKDKDKERDSNVTESADL